MLGEAGRIFGGFFTGGLGGEVPHITFKGGGWDTMKAREAQSMGFKARLCEDGGKAARPIFYLNPPTTLSGIGGSAPKPPTPVKKLFHP